MGYANEQGLKYALTLQDQAKAALYFSEARDAYYSWGALGKTMQLDSLYPSLSKTAPPSTFNPAFTPSEIVLKDKMPSIRAAGIMNSLGTSGGSSVLTSPALSVTPKATLESPNVNQPNAITTTLDLASVMKACQVLSSEMDLTKLLQSMVKVCNLVSSTLTPHLPPPSVIFHKLFHLIF